jgi:hypothetical protein
VTAFVVNLEELQPFYLQIYQVHDCRKGQKFATLFEQNFGNAIVKNYEECIAGKDVFIQTESIALYEVNIDKFVKTIKECPKVDMPANIFEKGDVATDSVVEVNGKDWKMHKVSLQIISRLIGQDGSGSGSRISNDQIVDVLEKIKRLRGRLQVPKEDGIFFGDGAFEDGIWDEI